MVSTNLASFASRLNFIRGADDEFACMPQVTNDGIDDIKRWFGSETQNELKNAIQRRY
jgi:hypothetical protein